MSLTLSPEPLVRHEPQVEELLQRFYEHDFSRLLAPPETYKNSGGRPLWGFDEKNLSRAALHYGSHIALGRYDAALQLLPQLRATIEIDALALMLLDLVFPRVLWEKFSPPRVAGDRRSPLYRLILRLYEQFTGKSADEIEALLENADAHALSHWRRFVTDEDHPTYEQLSKYYNALVFPQGDLLPNLAESRLSVAYRAIPLALGKQTQAKSGFDYGGGSGFTTSAMARAGFRDVCLIEENQTMLNFARWRDEQCGNANIRYMRETEMVEQLERHRGRYDIGICTEVLEHVIDVEGTIRRLANLMKPGGYLFFSASFGMYPHLSHLKQNVRYAGHEDELMARVGFTPAKINLSIPMLNTTRLYVRGKD